MLHPLIFLSFLVFSPLAVAQSCEQQTQSCAVLSPREDALLQGVEPPQGDDPLQEENTIAKDIAFFQQSSTQKMNDVLHDKRFQEFVAGINKGQLSSPSLDSSGHEKEVIPFKKLKPQGTNSLRESTSHLYVFVSFSLGEKALLNLAHEARQQGATLILRGFKDGSYIKTAHALQKVIHQTGQGFLIDPELFTLFAVTAVPTIVFSKPIPLLSSGQEDTLRVGTLRVDTLRESTLSPSPPLRGQTPFHDRLQGHVSLRYALERFANSGDLKEEAQLLLQKGALK